MCEITLLSPCALYLFSFFSPRNFSNEESSLNAILPYEESRKPFADWWKSPPSTKIDSRETEKSTYSQLHSWDGAGLHTGDGSI